jgi:esterase/lipase
MARLAEIDAELHELPDYEKGIQVGLEKAMQLIQKEIDKITDPRFVNKGYIDGLKAALSVVRVSNE